MKLLFLLSLITVLYTYIGYPVLIYLLSLFYKKPLRGKYIYPEVSIIVAAHNEEANIERKIKSLMSLDYPQKRYEILIGSDGSTDRTEEILSRYNNGNLRVFKRSERRGKPAMLNMLIPEAKSEIVVLTDARQRLDKNTLSELVKHFTDQKVGSVSSALFYENGDQAQKTGTGVGMYWEYEKFIRKSESRMGSMLGATGALYAIRKKLFTKLPEDLLLDDIYIPMRIVEKGYRAIFDSKAKVYDKVFGDPKEEFLRRVRTLAGNFQLFYYLRGLFNPLKGKISWQFFSHKFLRLIVPLLLVGVFVSNLFLLQSQLYKFIFILQVCFYSFALMGLFFKAHKNRIFDLPYMFCLMNVAALVGLYKFITNKQGVLWRKGTIAHS